MRGWRGVEGVVVVNLGLLAQGGEAARQRDGRGGGGGDDGKT